METGHLISLVVVAIPAIALLSIENKREIDSLRSFGSDPNIERREEQNLITSVTEED